MTKLTRLILFVSTIIIANKVNSQTVTIDHQTQRYIGEVSELDRTKFFTLHANSGDARVQDFYKEFNVSPGRGFWGAFSYAKSKTGTVGKYPAYKNSNNKSVRNVSRFVATEHPNSVLRYNLSKEAGANWAAEYYKNHVTDQSRPEFFEPMNEPFVHSRDDVFKKDQADGQKVKLRMAEWFGAIGKKFDETPELAKIKVIGYSSAWPSMELWDFGHWNSNMKMFMDVAGNHIDAFAVHLYDGINVTGQNNRRSGSNSEAILDLMETYSFKKWGIVKPHAITEYGAIERGYGPEYTDVKSALSIGSINSILFNLLDRENRMAISIPFITGSSKWHLTQANNYHPYAPALWRPTGITPTSNPNRPNIAGWKYTAKVNFFKLWSDVKGKRIKVTTDNPDIQIQGFAHGKKVYIALNNLDDNNQNTRLDFVSGLVGLQNVRIKKLKIFDNANPQYSDSNQNTAPASIKLIPRETVVLEYTFASDVAQTNSIRTKNYYSSKYLQKINANTEIAYAFNGVKTGTGYATIKMGISRKHDRSKLPVIKVNGTAVTIPSNWKGYDQNNRKDFFGTLDIPIPMNVLASNNNITVKFPDAGGRVSSMILQVNKYDKDIVDQKDEITLVNVPKTIAASSYYEVDVAYEAAVEREIQVDFWSANGYVASSITQKVPAGKGEKRFLITLPEAPKPGTGYIFKAHIRPVGTKWQQAIKWSTIGDITVTPDYQDTLTILTNDTAIKTSKTFTVEVNYEAAIEREIQVDLWSATGYVGSSITRRVPAGKRSENFVVTLTETPEPGEGYFFKAHIRPVGTEWQQAIKWVNADAFTILPEYEDSLAIVWKDTAIKTSKTFTVEVNYEAAIEREIQVDLWSATGYVGSSITRRVPAGKRNENFVVALVETPEPGEGYFFKAHIRPVGTEWQQAIKWVNADTFTILPEYEDSLAIVGQDTTVEASKTYTVTVRYEAAIEREIQVDFWSATNYIASSITQRVPAGKGSKEFTVELPEVPTPGEGYIIKAHIRPVGTKWQQALKWAQVSNITVIASYEDEVTFVNAKQSMIQANSYTVDVKYEAPTDREIIVEFWSATNWIAQQKVIVARGEGTKTITVDLPQMPEAGEGYLFKTHIRPVNTTWREALAADQIKDVKITPLFTQEIADGTYYIASPFNNQRLLSRSLEKYSAVMHNPGEYTDQKWQFTHIGDNVYTIMNVGTNRYLEVPYGSCRNGANVSTWTNATDAHKKWKVVFNQNEGYALKPLHCLDKGLDRAAGKLDANAQIWDYSEANNNQKWDIIATNDVFEAAITREVSEVSKNLVIYPNPVTEVLYIQDLDVDATVVIYDSHGRTVMTKTMNKNDLDKSIDASLLNDGLYFISLNGSEPTRFYKD